MNQVIPVAVVGAGPCGLMMALLLARAGVEVVVFDRKSGISTHPKAMGLTSRTLEIFRQLGLEAAIEKASLPLEGRSLQIWCRSLAGEELGRVPLSDSTHPHSPCGPQHCPQTETEKVLMDALAREPLAKVCFDCEVTEVHQTPEGGELKMTDGSLHFFHWLIAADGAGSLLRRQLRIPTSGPGDLGHFLNVEFMADYGDALTQRPALMYPALWAEGMETFVAVNGRDHWLMHHFLQPTERPEDYPPERLEGIIREASGMPDREVRVLGVSPWVMSPRMADEFRSGRTFLIGDAAARLSPAGGLGLNTGLHSVHNLAWKLAAVVRGEAAESLLGTYQAERHPLSAAILRSTNQNAGEVFAVVKEAMEGNWTEVKEIIAHSRRAQSGVGFDLGFCYRSEAVVASGEAGADGVCQTAPQDYEPDASPGHRAPHVLVESAGREISLLDFFGGKFVLVAARSAVAWEVAGLKVRLVREGHDFRSEAFAPLYGLERGGAVLVRPDGVVAARWKSPPGNPGHEVRSALSRVLAVGL